MYRGGLIQVKESIHMPRSVFVVAAVIQRDDRFLLGLRPRRKRHGGMWEFPGGKVEAGEDVETALRRELREELSLELMHCGKTLFAARDPGSPFMIRFVEVTVSGDPETIEHERLEWLGTRELLDFPLAPTDARFVREGLGAR
jgi:8-oxo-dGTP diphosphatase